MKKISYYLPGVPARGFALNKVCLCVYDAEVQRWLFDAAHQQMHGLISHDLCMDMDAAQRRVAESGLSGVVKTKNTDIFRDDLSNGKQRAHGVTCHKVVCADEDVRQFIQRIQLLRDLIRVIVSNAVFFIDRHTSCSHGKGESKISLVK